MDLWIAIVVAIAYAAMWTWVGYQISDHYRQQEFEGLLQKIEELEEEVIGLRNEVDGEPVTAAKFRIRTLESDPKRHSRVVSARLRAKKYPRPDPRR